MSLKDRVNKVVEGILLPSSPSGVLKFLLEVGKLKCLKRTGWVMRKIEDCESVAGHMYRMGIMALYLDNKTLDRDRCIKMALIHDIPECIVGDITPFCGVSKEEKHKQEMEAMNKLCSLIGEKIGIELLSLYVEYEEQKTTEAKAVKDLDKFDMLLQAYEYELYSNFELNLQDFFDNTKGIQNEAVLRWFQELQYERNKNLDDALSSEVEKPKSKSFVLELFMIIGKLKHQTLECWKPNKAFELETVANHIYRMSIMVFLLDDSSSGLDIDKCVKIALIQSIANFHVDILVRHLTKEKIDETCLVDMQNVCECLDKRVKKEFLDLFKEYQAQHTKEAKLVKDLDEFEYLLHIYESNSKAESHQLLLHPSTPYHSIENAEVSRWEKKLKELCQCLEVQDIQKMQET